MCGDCIVGPGGVDLLTDDQWPATIPTLEAGVAAAPTLYGEEACCIAGAGGELLYGRDGLLSERRRRDESLISLPSCSPLHHLMFSCRPFMLR